MIAPESVALLKALPASRDEGREGRREGGRKGGREGALYLVEVQDAGRVSFELLDLGH